MSEEKSVLLTIDDGVATVTMNQPRKFNSLDGAMLSELFSAILDISENPAARVMVLRGNGAAFCSGGDLKSMADNLDRIEGTAGYLIDTANAVVLAMRRLAVPVICSVHGAAAGGGFAVAMGGDMVVAAESARFVFAYSKIAVSPDAGLSYVLTERLGARRAIEALLLRTQFSAAEMLELGLVNRVVADNQLAAATQELAMQLAQLPPTMAREVKRIVNERADNGLGHQMSLERAAFVRCAKSPEFAERVRAFMEKRR